MISSTQALALSLSDCSVAMMSDECGIMSICSLGQLASELSAAFLRADTLTGLSLSELASVLTQLSRLHNNVVTETCSDMSPHHAPDTML